MGNFYWRMGMGNVDERFLIGLIAGEGDHDHDHDQHHDYDHDDGDIMAYYSFLIYSQLTASEYSALIYKCQDHP